MGAYLSNLFGPASQPDECQVPFRTIVDRLVKKYQTNPPPQGGQSWHKFARTLLKAFQQFFLSVVPDEPSNAVVMSGPMVYNYLTQVWAVKNKQVKEDPETQVATVKKFLKDWEDMAVAAKPERGGESNILWCVETAAKLKSRIEAMNPGPLGPQNKAKFPEIEESPVGELYLNFWKDPIVVESTTQPTTTTEAT